MRQGLAAFAGMRLRFRAVVIRFGRADYHGNPCDTVCLGPVEIGKSGYDVTDHVWVRRSRQWRALGVREGDTVEFVASVGQYMRGYTNPYRGIDQRELDVKLRYVENLKRLTNNGLRATQ